MRIWILAVEYSVIHGGRKPEDMTVIKCTRRTAIHSQPNETVSVDAITGMNYESHERY
jgi:hypothetical protein